jgi:hypothetical protein
LVRVLEVILQKKTGAKKAIAIANGVRAAAKSGSALPDSSRDLKDWCEIVDSASKGIIDASVITSFEGSEDRVALAALSGEGRVFNTLAKHAAREIQHPGMRWIASVINSVLDSLLDVATENNCLGAVEERWNQMQADLETEKRRARAVKSGTGNKASKRAQAKAARPPNH